MVVLYCLSLFSSLVLAAHEHTELDHNKAINVHCAPNKAANHTAHETSHDQNQDHEHHRHLCLSSHFGHLSEMNNDEQDFTISFLEEILPFPDSRDIPYPREAQVPIRPPIAFF